MILFTKPKASQGQGYLRLDKNLWFYDPSVGKWERRTERERIGGTNSRRSDFDESRLAIEYDPTFVAEEKLGAYTAHGDEPEGQAGHRSGLPGDQAVGRQGQQEHPQAPGVRAVGQAAAHLVLPQVEEGLQRIKKADVWYPQEIRFFDEVEKANQTLILIKTVDLKPLEANLFTKAWLESKSR